MELWAVPGNVRMRAVAYFVETFVALIAETVAAAIVHVSIFRVAVERAFQTRIVHRGASVLLVAL